MTRTQLPDTLVISDNFFGYATDIVNELDRRGRKTLWFKDRPLTDTRTKALIRVNPALVARRSDEYFRIITETARELPISLVLVIKGEALSEASIQRLRAALPKAEFALYFWDSYGNMPSSSAAKVGLFDRALTFDIGDAEHDRRLLYRPLFYVPAATKPEAVEQDIDFLFVGTAHGDRVKVIRNLRQATEGRYRTHFFMFSPSKPLLRVRQVVDRNFWGSRVDDFSFTPMARSELAGLVARSKVSIDVERREQSGLTMRTIEMLGAGRKLMTTNLNVLSADFYRPENILVFDRAAPQVSPEFLETAYRSLPADIMYRYSLQGWLDDVLPTTAAIGRNARQA